MIKIVENNCPEKKQELANFCLSRNTVASRIKDDVSDIKRQREAKEEGKKNYSIVCYENTDASDTVELLIF